MKRYLIVREKDNVEVAILPHKDGSGYSYVNLTKGHICPCVFETVADAIRDCRKRLEVICMYKIE